MIMNTSPVSAFAAYKNLNKGKKRKHVEDNQQVNKIKNAKKPRSSSSPIQNGFKAKKTHTKENNGSKNGKKKKADQLEIALSEYDSDEPPLLVPVYPDNKTLSQIEEQRVDKVLSKKSSNKKVKTTDNLKETKTRKVPIIKKKKSKTDDSLKSVSVFKWLISPVLPSYFLENFWENEVLYLERDNADNYRDILTTKELDHILREYPLHYTRNIDVVSYENGVKEVHNQEGRAVASVLWDYYANGCSIRLLNPQTYSNRVHVLISTLQEYFGTMVGANVYLTPPGSQGFAPHYDDIEAFILQLEGRKHWKLYKPKGSDVLARNSSGNFKSDELDDPFMEVTLNAGDLLYFPRGTIHEGRTDEDSHSLHITVSVYQHTAYADLLENILPNALKNAAENDVNFRKGLPINYLKHVGCVNKDLKSPTRNNIIKNVKQLISVLVEYVDVDSAADQLGRKFMHDAMPPILSREEAIHSSNYDGDYMEDGRVFNRVEIDLETKIRLVRYYSLRVVSESDTAAKIYYCTDNSKVYHGEEEQWLEIDPKLLPVIKTLQRTYPDYMDVEALPVDDEVVKLQLVADLWERGLLVTSAPLPCVSDEGSEDECDEH